MSKRLFILLVLLFVIVTATFLLKWMMSPKAYTRTEELVLELSHPDEKRRKEAAETLKYTDSAYNLLVALKNHGDTMAQGLAIQIFDNLNAPVLPGFTKAFRSKDKELRRLAAYYLVMGKPRSTSIPLLISDMQDHSSDSRNWATKGFRRVWKKINTDFSEIGMIKHAVTGLIQLLKHRNGDVRKNVLSLLSNLKPPATGTIPMLVQMIKQESKSCDFHNYGSKNKYCNLRGIYNALEYMKEAVLPVFKKLLSSKDKLFRFRVIYVYTSLKDDVKLYSSHCLKVLRGSDVRTARAVASEIGGADLLYYGQEKWKLPVLLQALQHKDRVVRLFGIRGLSNYHLPRLPGALLQPHIPKLIQGLKDSRTKTGSLLDGSMRIFSARLLGRMGAFARSAIPALTRLAQNKRLQKKIKDFELHVRMYPAQAMTFGIVLFEMKKAVEEAEEALRKIRDVRVP